MLSAGIPANNVWNAASPGSAMIPREKGEAYCPKNYLEEKTWAVKITFNNPAKGDDDQHGGRT
jgi:hypothetical protein